MIQRAEPTREEGGSRGMTGMCAEDQKKFVWTNSVLGLFLGIGLMGTVFAAVVLGLMSLPFMEDPSHDWSDRGSMAAVLAGAFWLLGAALALLTPKRITASADGLILERAIQRRPQVIPRAEIAGVRATGGERQQPGRVEIVLRKRPMITLLTGDYEPRTYDARAALLGLYGSASVDPAWERVACCDDAVAMSQKTVEFSFTPRPRWVMVVDVVSVLVLIAIGVWWKELHQWLVYSRDPNRLLVLGVLFGGTGAVVTLALTALDVARGGASLWMRVGPDGIVVQKRWRRSVMPRERIEGVSALQYPYHGRMRRCVRVRLNRRWSWVVGERGIVAEPGLVAGVLMHRFGEWVPRSRESEKDSTRAAGGLS